MKTWIGAIALLTVFPVPAPWLGRCQDHARCVALFPVVGMLIGAIAWGITAALVPVMAGTPAAVLLIGCLTGISGGLHLDGLADTADGFLSGRPREQVLNIMRDSRIGTMGVAAILFVVLLKISLVANAVRWDPARWIGGVALMPVAGRCSLVWAMRLNRCVREAGLGQTFWNRSWLLSALSLVILAGGGIMLMGWRGAAATLAAVVVTAIFSLWCRWRIGGATGDTLGACCELTEAGFLLFAVGWEGDI